MAMERLSHRKGHRKILRKASFAMRFNALMLFVLLHVFFFITLGTSLYVFVHMGKEYPQVWYLVIFLSVFGIYTLWAMDRIRILMLIGEFQTMLCAGALSLHAKFTVIVNERGTVIYGDPHFYRIFKNHIRQGEQRINTILSKEGLDASGLNALRTVIQDGIHQQFAFTLKTKEGEAPLTIVAQALERPEGYVVLRGYPRAKK
ncbi:MAG: hypothetical protein K0R63_1576 [Rickettsiales bacterium]|jgi:hypothetical protein|nr:hypothetical protein [Rickettsiales bacterium]